MAALMKWLPEGQILYGTDFPWGTLAASRAAIARLGLPDDRLAAIESRNAVCRDHQEGIAHRIQIAHFTSADQRNRA